MNYIRITDLEDFNLNENIKDAYLYIVNPNAEMGTGSKRISVADFIYGIKVNMERIVLCQYCGQPTYSDRPCEKCGGQPIGEKGV